MNPSRTWIIIGALYGLLSLFAGTVGAHYLPDSLAPGAHRTYDTAIRIQMFHAIVLLVLGLLSDRWKSRTVDLAGILITAGTLIFCGSLYILALAGLGVFGAIAPVGGMALILGWLSLLAGAVRRPPEG